MRRLLISLIDVKRVTVSKLNTFTLKHCSNWTIHMRRRYHQGHTDDLGFITYNIYLVMVITFDISSTSLFKHMILKLDSIP